MPRAKFEIEDETPDGAELVNQGRYLMERLRMAIEEEGTPRIHAAWDAWVGFGEMIFKRTHIGGSTS